MRATIHFVGGDAITVDIEPDVLRKTYEHFGTPGSVIFTDLAVNRSNVTYIEYRMEQRMTKFDRFCVACEQWGDTVIALGFLLVLAVAMAIVVVKGFAA